MLKVFCCKFFNKREHKQKHITHYARAVIYNLNLFILTDRKYWRRRRDDAVKLRFPVEFFDRGVQVENAELRLLAPPLPGQEVHAVKISQVLGARRRRVLQERTVYLSPSLSKWLEFDVTEAVKDWLKGERNLGIELECPACLDVWQPLEAYLNVLVRPESNRAKRSAGREEGRTDCRGNGKQKPRCCRHKMPVVFQELDMPEMQYIVQPKVYEAGFCKGRCPPNYNHATNHSRIQSMVHKLNNKTPKVCCAPSKLESLEILRVHPHNAGKLVIETWDNMKVLECACS